MKNKPKSQQRRTCRLILLIKDEDGQETAYIVRPVRSDWHARAYQVRKDAETTYAVAQEYNGTISCDCGRGIYRSGRCKHGSALLSAGLLLSAAEVAILNRHSTRSPRARQDTG